MANPIPRRKPATDLEIRLSSGSSVEPKELIDAIDQPMHDELVNCFRSELSVEERDGLARDIFVKLLKQPQKYDATLASLVQYAKVAVRNQALDYIAERCKTLKQQSSFIERGYLSLAPAEPPGPFECAEEAAAYEAALNAVKVAIMALPPGQRLAVEAYQKHGPTKYSSILAAELGISPNLTAQWWRRAKANILKSIGDTVQFFE